MRRFLIIIEKTAHNYSAYSPDLPGCVATGKTRKQVEKNMKEAMAFHIQGLREDHQAVPVPKAIAEYVAV